MARFYIRRKTGYMSPYVLTMLYGAAVLAPRKYGRPFVPVFVRVGRSFVKIPRTVLVLFRPFNKYQPGRKK